MYLQKMSEIHCIKMLQIKCRYIFDLSWTLENGLWVDSFKRRNDVGNLTLLSNVRFSTSFRHLEESTLWPKSSVQADVQYNFYYTSSRISTRKEAR